METGSWHLPTILDLFINQKLVWDDKFEVYRKIDEALRGGGVWVLGFFSGVDHISKVVMHSVRCSGNVVHSSYSLSIRSKASAVPTVAFVVPNLKSNTSTVSSFKLVGD